MTEYMDTFMRNVRFIFTCGECGSAVVPEFIDVHDEFHNAQRVQKFQDGEGSNG